MHGRGEGQPELNPVLVRPRAGLAAGACRPPASTGSPSAITQWCLPAGASRNARASWHHCARRPAMPRRQHRQQERSKSAAGTGTHRWWCRLRSRTVVGPVRSAPAATPIRTALSADRPSPIAADPPLAPPTTQPRPSRLATPVPPLPPGPAVWTCRWLAARSARNPAARRAASTHRRAGRSQPAVAAVPRNPGRSAQRALPPHPAAALTS